YLKALPIAEGLAADPRNVSSVAEYGAVLIRLGALDVPPPEFEESLSRLRRGAELMATDEFADKGMLMMAHEYMGLRLTALGRYKEAIAEHGQALALADGLLAQRPRDRAIRPGVVDANLGIARACILAGDPRKSLAVAEALVART